MWPSVKSVVRVRWVPPSVGPPPAQPAHPWARYLVLGAARAATTSTSTSTSTTITTTATAIATAAAATHLLSLCSLFSGRPGIHEKRHLCVETSVPSPSSNSAWRAGDWPAPVSSGEVE